MTTETLRTAAVASRAEFAAIGLAAALGLALLFVAGFSHAAALHDVAHDQRHAIAFPCH